MTPGCATCGSDPRGGASDGRLGRAERFAQAGLVDAVRPQQPGRVRVVDKQQLEQAAVDVRVSEIAQPQAVAAER